MNIYLIGHNCQPQCQQIARLFSGDLQCISTNVNFQSPATNHIISRLIAGPIKIAIETQLKQGELIIQNTKTELLPSRDNAVVKRAIIKSLFDCLADYYHYRPAWGILVGVRPTKLVNSLFDDGYNKRQIATILAEKYYLSNSKINLLLEICQAERPYLANLKRNAFSIYIGIPFCPTRCNYCSFTALPAKRGSAVIERYVAALIAELKGLGEACANRYIDAVYFGGGTPALLTAQQIDRIFAIIRRYYQTEKIREITFEAGRPELIDDVLLAVLKRNGVNRICINPQTMHDISLQKIGRSHSSDDIRRAFELAKKYRFKAINADLIAGLSGENVVMFKQSLQQVMSYQPDNITIHTLALKRGSHLAETKLDKHYGASEITSRQLQQAAVLLRQANYYPYYMYRQKQMLGNLENVGYSLMNKESLYNIVIIEEKQTILAFGAATSSKIVTADGSLKQLHNPKDVTLYMARIAQSIANKCTALNSMSQSC